MFPTIHSQQGQIVQVRLTFPKTKPATQTSSSSIGLLWISIPTSRSQRCARTRTKCGATTEALACTSTVLQPPQKLALDVEAPPTLRGRTTALTSGSTSWRHATECAAMTRTTTLTDTGTNWKDIASQVRFYQMAIQSTGSIGIGIALVLSSPRRSTVWQTTRLPLDTWSSRELQVLSRRNTGWRAPR